MNRPTNAALYADSELPEISDPLIQSPDHIFNPFAGQSRQPGHRFALIQTESRWLWAHVLRAMSGWKVISAGHLNRTLFKTADEASEYLAAQFLGPDRDGVDRLSHEAFLQQGNVAHIRDEDAPGRGYCGKTGRQAVFDTSEPDHAEQHCIACDRKYRARHYGRMAITY